MIKTYLVNNVREVKVKGEWSENASFKAYCKAMDSYKKKAVPVKSKRFNSESYNALLARLEWETEWARLKAKKEAKENRAYDSIKAKEAKDKEAKELSYLLSLIPNRFTR